MANLKYNPSLIYDDLDTLKNLGMGGLSGAAEIGSNLLYPVDKTLNATGLSDFTNEQRKQALQDYFGENSDQNSAAFNTGNLAASLAGTAGVGGGAGTLLKLLSRSPKALQIAEALRMGGMAKNVPTITNMTGGLGSGALGTLLIDSRIMPR